MIGESVHILVFCAPNVVGVNALSLTSLKLCET